VEEKGENSKKFDLDNRTFLFAKQVRAFIRKKRMNANFKHLNFSSPCFELRVSSFEFFIFS